MTELETSPGELRNTPEFGRTMARVRRHFASKITSFDMAGGPDRNYIAKIEDGTDMPITKDTLDKYTAAINKIDAHQDLDPTFLGSLGRIFKSADIDWSSFPESSGRELRQRATALGAVMLGVDMLTGDYVTANSVRAVQTRRPNGSVTVESVLQQHFGAELLPIALGRIARMTPAVTLLPHAHVAALGPLFAVARDWEQQSQGRRLSFGLTRQPKAILDPLAGVTDLASAVERAEALGATGTDAVITGWAILSANARAAQRLNTSPIHVWPPSSMQPTHKTDDAAMPGRPSYEDMLAAGKKWIKPWAIEHTAASWSVSFTVEPPATTEVMEIDGGPVLVSIPDDPHNPRPNEISWHSNHVQDIGEVTLAAGDLCVYNDEQFGRLGNVLAHMGLPTQVLTETSLNAQITYPPRTYELLPISPHYSYALAREVGQNQWQALQMFPDRHTP